MGGSVPNPADFLCRTFAEIIPLLGSLILLVHYIAHGNLQ